ncbi:MULTISPECIES: AraC family transcriptional regulator [Agrobacterium]|uniref:AraC family transcriptional regulator n=1 Tax=Agrobacterium tumefaciens TaxID=358 RepID=A0AAE6EHY4_AGRTU|nr:MULTISPECIES: AraC family transcriptional regulator [Agrobacterium]QCL77070.1 AraC family transcriptional regulator [Agrobacterium tumefaciens]QCL82578.1 AraC family transcriptional regulator [Agrobacterium tumefaciens]CUX70001.1 putative AraC type helix-turn-helix [Agrobacterium sp. NCPPB 925]
MKATTLQPEKFYIRAVSLIGFSEMVGSAGYDPKELLVLAGIDQSALDDVDLFISANKFGTLLEVAASHMQRPTFGIDWAKNMVPFFQNLGPVMLAATKARTMREWIQRIEAYWHSHTNAYRPRRIKMPGTSYVACRFEFDNSTALRRQKIESIFASISLLTRVLTGLADKHHVMVRFRHGGSVNRGIYEEVFRCPIEFNAEHYEIVFDDRHLDLPVACSKEYLNACAAAHFHERVSRMPVFQGTAQKTVETMIRSMLGVGVTSAEVIARSMGMGTKTLQRRLADENSSYVEILEDIRRGEAVRLLGTTKVPMFRLAKLLDYSSAPPFNLAFRRWTGLSPSEYRRANSCERETPSVALAQQKSA